MQVKVMLVATDANQPDRTMPLDFDNPVIDMEKLGKLSPSKKVMIVVEYDGKWKGSLVTNVVVSIAETLKKQDYVVYLYEDYTQAASNFLPADALTQLQRRLFYVEKIMVLTPSSLLSAIVTSLGKVRKDKVLLVTSIQVAMTIVRKA